MFTFFCFHAWCQYCKVNKSKHHLSLLLLFEFLVVLLALISIKRRFLSTRYLNIFHNHHLDSLLRAYLINAEKQINNSTVNDGYSVYCCQKYTVANCTVINQIWQWYWIFRNISFSSLHYEDMNHNLTLWTLKVQKQSPGGVL